MCGTRYQRVWKGKKYEVTALGNGKFEYDGNGLSIAFRHRPRNYRDSLERQTLFRGEVMVMQTIPKKRCAIYTRKSVEEGLDQEFNSLDAQREAGEAYIASQKANGWVSLPTRYDDGGYSGGNMKRPALQQLLADCEAGLVDIIVVYKIDRLSRSICDFADLSRNLTNGAHSSSR